MKKYYGPFLLRKRLLIFVLVALTVFSALFFRLFDLVMISGNRVQRLATEQWMRGLPLAAKRGEVFDSSGNLLVTNETTYDIYLRARNVKDASRVATELAQILGKSYDGIYDKATNIRISESLVKMQVSYDDSMNIISKNLDGVYLSQNVARVYPYKDTLTQILGFTTIDNAGQAGVESYYNKFLKGVAGRSLTQTNAQGKELEDRIKYYLPSIDGLNIKLEIDIAMQLILEKNLQQVYNEHKAKGATGIILDAETGGILAMSNKPSFDLNEPPRDNVSNLNKLSKNSAVVDVYEPGSTFKIFTLTAGLAEGVVHLDDRFYCGGSCMVDGQRIKCWRSIGHGSQTLPEAFKNSCNCAFVNIAQRLGVQKLYKYLDMFGIGQKTGVDISSESSGIVIDENRVKLVDLVRIGFGQTVAVTPLQMVTGVAEVVTGKTLYPHLMSEISSNGSIKMQNKYVSNKLNIDDTTLQTMRQLLRSNLNGFDDTFTYIEGYDVGGKTGTAQKYENGVIASGKYVSSFVGVYPAHQPKYVLLVAVDEPSTGAYYGGVVASPAAKNIFKDIIDAKNWLPDRADEVGLKPNIQMPSLIGKTISEACALLQILGLYGDIVGEGGYVTAQLPSAYTMLYSSTQVVIMT